MGSFIQSHFRIPEVPDLKIESLFEDSRGRLWVGLHDAGLARWNGSRFERSEHPSDWPGSSVFSILEDAEGALWCGTDAGLLRVEETGECRLVPGTQHLSFLWGSCLDPNGNLWFGLERRDGQPPALMRWDGRRLDEVPLPARRTDLSIHAVTVDGGGRIWVGGDGLWRQGDVGEFQSIYSVEDELRQVADLWWDDERLWMSSDSGLWLWIDGRLKGISSEKDSAYSHRSLWVDEEGDVWATTQDGYLLRYTEEGVSEDVFCAASLVSGGLLQDRSGALWMGTYGDGLYRLDMRRLTDRDGDSFRPVRALTEDHKGCLYAATRIGVQLVDKEGMHPCPGTERIQGNEIRSVYVDRQNRLWIGLWGGQIFVRKEKTLYQVPAPSFENSPVQFLEDGAGRLWIGSLYGMDFGYVLDGRLHPLRPDEAPRWVGAMALDGQGRLWVGGSRSGEGLHCHTGLRFETHSSLAPLTTCRILSLCWADETLWIGTNRGLYRWEDRQLHLELTRADLACPIITALGWMAGRLWIGTEGAGAFTFDGRHLQQPGAPAGMDAEVIWAFYADSRGRLWGATAGGLRTYDQPLPLTCPAPSPHLAVLRKQFLGTGPAIEEIWEQLLCAADTDLAVLLLGETGTGKTLLARVLHQISPRRNGPFIAVNCSALPANLIEAELFGYEQGAFTGALARKIGRFERAEGGTLFLDEIGDLSVDLQAKLLHVLQDGTYERVGGIETLQADVRLLYATHQDLQRAVAEGRFREDLFWRIHVLPIRLPALRERKADIPLLARRFLEQQAQQWGWPTPRLTPSFLEVLQAHPWPGNVRELENVLCQALLKTRGVEALDRTHVQNLVPESGGQKVASLASALANLQVPDVISRDDLLQMYYRRVCELTQGAVYGEHGAGRLLGMSGEKLTYWLKKLGLKEPR